MSYKIWNKLDDVNGVNALYFINKYNIKTSDEVILILTKTGNVSSLLIKDKIIDNYDLDINLSVDEVAQKYLEILEQEKIDKEKDSLSLEEATNKISILEAEQEVQNNEIMTSMIANTELFEMVLGMMPATLNTKNINNTKGVSSMVEVYVTLILKGQKTIDQVPAIIREQVQAQLDLLTK